MTLEDKWRKRWKQAKIFESQPNDQKKFFGTIPYPYVNSYLHLGFFYTSMRMEALARFKRMIGFNVLYPQAWHCTGSPIVNAAKRVADGEPKQIAILRMQGFSEEDIKEFADPKKWIEFFPGEAQKDLEKMGYSIDWRRSFITTDLNPHYDAFIRWQFNRLKEGGYVVKGKFPVVWDPVENEPVGDHARLEGEGETPQEYTLVKHRLDDAWVVSATLRPDTIMGVTNLYVNPASDLVRAKVDDEVWFVSEKTARELDFQDKKVEIVEHITGKDLIGKKVDEFAGHTVPILPAAFVSTEVGTGIVHSVPSDSADDLIALYDLQKDEEMLKKYNLNPEEVRSIRPIAVIDIPGYGDIPADDVLKKLDIKNQKEKDKLRKAKEMLYKDGFYKGKLNTRYKENFSQDLSGKPVQQAKDQIKEELQASDFGDRYYQLTGKVVARSLSECVVKIVDDQWFLAYGDEDWKKKAHKALDAMKLYPEKTRSQFDYVIDWLHNWACTREVGLGTRLPWDESWLIESLSDSTIYMAFYTIAHKIKDIDPKKLNDNFFDYVLLGKDVDVQIGKKLADELREEFAYWYPMDYRNTGKDLIQNHMSFCIFNHTAIFPQEHWPVSFGLNGHVMIDGEKMSKSKGNFITIRQAHETYGADASRFAALSGGEGVDDANFDTELARSMKSKLDALLDFAEEYGKGREEKQAIDEWFEATMDNLVLETTRHYDETLFRSALQKGYFEMQNALRWYMRRTRDNPHKETINRFIETQAKLIAPITPFVAEEIWESIGKQGFISQAPWPEGKATPVPASEDIVKSTLEDIYAVLNMLDIDAEKITLFVAEPWKYELYEMLNDMLKDTRDFGRIMGQVMQHDKFKKHSKHVQQIIKKALKSGLSQTAKEDEWKAMEQSKEFFAGEFDVDVDIIKAEESKEKKANQALPGKPAILVE